MRIWAIIPAGGAGRRFGTKKQFETVANKPLLLYSLEKLAAVGSIEGIVVAVPEEDLARTKELIEKSSPPRAQEIRIVSGGKERQDSVKNGFDQLPECDLVVIHDAVRPLVSVSVIQKVLETAEIYGACTAGIPVHDTTKRTDREGVVQETVTRDSLWLIQTPQAFRWSILKEAFEAAGRDRFTGTDEATLVERIGRPVRVVEGDRLNIKITTEADLGLAEKLLRP